MNRPSSLRHMVAHVANRRVTGFRLRPPEVEPLVRYIEHLESLQRPAGDAVRARPLASLEPEERVLGGLEHYEEQRAVEIDPRPSREHLAACMLRETEPAHAGPCPIPMTQRTKAA